VPVQRIIQSKKNRERERERESEKKTLRSEKESELKEIVSVCVVNLSAVKAKKKSFKKMGRF
jgi:hypothetical protein